MLKVFRDIGFSKIDSVLFFDVETVLGQESLTEGSPQAEAWAYKRRKEEIDTFEKLNEDYRKNAALYPAFNTIVCISLGYVKDGELKIKSFIGDEIEILGNVFAAVDTFISKLGMKFLAGFNIKAFDVPVINFRALVNGMVPHHWFDVAAQKPWELKHLVDISDILRGTMFASMGLQEVCMAFGQVSPKDDISGGDVSKVYYTGGIDRIATYCDKDVRATIEVFKKII